MFNFLIKKEKVKNTKDKGKHFKNRNKIYSVSNDLQACHQIEHNYSVRYLFGIQNHNLVLYRLSYPEGVGIEPTHCEKLRNTQFDYTFH